MKLDTHELAWAAGFFDGEGNIRVGQFASVWVNVTQNDPRPLWRFWEAVGRIGKVLGPYTGRGQRSSHCIYSVSSFENAQAVAAMLWKFLSAPKREQVVMAFRTHKELQVAKASSGLSWRKFGRSRRPALVPTPHERAG